MNFSSQPKFNFRKEELHGPKVAYFCMEYAIDQSLKLYSGGLGFLAGSHLRSAYALKQNFIAVGILWKYGYYDQERSETNLMETRFIEKKYSFLQDTGIIFPVLVHDHMVYVKAYYLSPEIFNSAPLFLLSTDIPENDYLSRTITHHLYDKTEATKIAQSIILGVGGGKLLDILGEEPDTYHMNEGHALPLLFYLYSKFRNTDEIKKRFVFTTHTPEAAGNEEHKIELLHEMSFFGELDLEDIRVISRCHGETMNYTLTALRFAKIANGVSKIHGEVSNNMWKPYDGICKIISITNAQNQEYWMDKKLKEALEQNNDDWLIWQKKEYKKELFEVVANQTGKLFNPDILTVVWARRFAGYKRADLILKNYQRFLDLVTRTHNPIQVIWAGKPYPFDQGSIQMFNKLIQITEGLHNCAVLTGYELKLSSMLKKGADIWLNNPKYPREASGTSGMTAAMNGAVNLSIADGWFPEFARNGENGFIFYPSNAAEEETQNHEDSHTILNILEHDIIPVYYHDKGRWAHIMKNSMKEVVPQFDSDRMAKEYYELLYSAPVTVSNNVLSPSHH